MSHTTSSRTTTMRAIIQDRYGAPEDVFRLQEVARPVPGDGEVLVRVHAVPVTGSDWHLFRGLPYAARPITGMRRPKNRVPGLELAGTVEAVGKEVRGLRPGDEVFGWYGGTLAEYVAVPQDQLAPKPPISRSWRPPRDPSRRSPRCRPCATGRGSGPDRRC
nr:hypothetical protein GCM10020093_035000 [Planobispora longispora]